MKKITSALLAVGLLAFLVGGCTQAKETSNDIVPIEVETSVEEVIEEEREALEIDFLDKSFTEMTEFIEIHKMDATQEEKDEMVLQYDEQLRENFKRLMLKYTEMDYFMAINETKDEQYVLHLDKISDVSIRREVESLTASGYGFQMLEGSYYLVIDYVKFNSMFKGIMSENLLNYYNLKSDEAVMPITVEEYLNISFEEVYKRVSTLETFIRDNPDFKFREDAKNWLNWYISSLLSVDIFSGAVDYETGFVSEKLKAVYEQVVESDLVIAKAAVEEMQAVIKEYDCIIKMDNQEATEAVSTVRNKYYQEVPVLVDRHYPMNTTLN